MLVLTRKTDEQILIGDEIKITLLRVRGNSVRIGIEAPRDIRVVRGELPEIESKAEAGTGFTLRDREQAFAHPPQRVEDLGRKRMPGNTSTEELGQGDKPRRETEPQVFAGRIRISDSASRLARAPLAEFVSAT